MAIPKKKGLRKIKVAGISYFWRVSLSHFKKDNMRITIGKIEQTDCIIRIDSFQIDKRLHFGDVKYSNIENEIEIVTPKFIRQVIEFVNLNNLNLLKRKYLHLTFENNTFKVNE